MRTIYRILNITSLFLVILGIISGMAIKGGFYDASILNSNVNYFSSVLAIGFMLMLFLSAAILFALNIFLKTAEKYADDKQEEQNVNY